MNGCCDGWVCLHRKTIDSMVFQHEGLFKVWCWCLMKANHEEKWVSVVTGKGSMVVKVEPGQFLFGRKVASKELRMKMSTLWDRMKILSKHQNIGIQSNSHYSIITIINWNTYQRNEIISDSQPDKQPTSNRQATDTNNNDNNDNKEIYCDSEAIASDEISVPKTKKKPDDTPYDELVELYHSVLSDLSPWVKISTARKTALRSRWNTSDNTKSIEWWKDFFEHIKSSNFLMGRTKPPFNCNLDWILKENNFLKIVEGKYINR